MLAAHSQHCKMVLHHSLLFPGPSRSTWQHGNKNHTLHIDSDNTVLERRASTAAPDPTPVAPDPTPVSWTPITTNSTVTPLVALNSGRALKESSTFVAATNDHLKPTLISGRAIRKPCLLCSHLLRHANATPSRGAQPMRSGARPTGAVRKHNTRGFFILGTQKMLQAKSQARVPPHYSHR